MDWSTVGEWLKNNAGTGASLVGSLLTGNLPGAIASGVALVSSATGTHDPQKALEALQTDPQTVVRLKELAVQDDENIRSHLRQMTEMKLKDEQAEHHETQETIRSGDNADDRFVRFTRPGQSWISLFAAFWYIFSRDNPDIYIVGALLTLPFAYAGLRQTGKWVDAIMTRKPAT